jgi:hypothetical protein
MTRRWTLVALLVALAMAPSAAQTQYAFDAHSFTITLPAGFSLADEASPQAGYKRWGFVTQSRADGLNGVIQVGLFDAARMGGTGTIDEFVKIMAYTLQASYGDWSGQVQRLPFLGDSRLVQWTGSRPHPATGAAVPMRGILVVGSQQHIYFRLDAFDTESMAPKTLPAADVALASFKLMVAPPAQ